MKISKFIFLAILSLISFNCNDNSRDLPLEKPLTLTTETFDVVGKTHNQALNYIYDELITKSKSIKYEDINEASINYVFKINPETKITKDNPADLRTLEQKNIIRNIVENPENKSFNELLEKRNLSTKQKKYIELLENEFKNKTSLLPQTIANIKNIEKEAISDLKDSEIVYILCLTSVAKNSLEYWSTEGKKWFMDENLKSTSSLQEGDIDWQAVAVADIVAFGYGFPSGVSTGMIAGGLALGVSTAGIGAGIGAVLGGLVGGSATGLASAITASTLTAAAYKITSIW